MFSKSQLDKLVSYINAQHGGARFSVITSTVKATTSGYTVADAGQPISDAEAFAIAVEKFDSRLPARVLAPVLEKIFDLLGHFLA